MEVKNFKINTERKRMAQDFDAEKISIVKNDVEINVYNFIQDSREDTEIYPTLEKYGCIDRLTIDNEKVYADLGEIKNLRNTMEQVQEANKLWINLPLEVRKEFNHSQKEFMDRGENWLKNKVEAEKPKVEIQEPIIKETIQEKA